MLNFLVYALVFTIFTYEAGWIKWPFYKWAEPVAWNRRSWPWLIIFSAYLIAVPIVILFG